MHHYLLQFFSEFAEFKLFVASRYPVLWKLDGQLFCQELSHLLATVSRRAKDQNGLPLPQVGKSKRRNEFVITWYKRQGLRDLLRYATIALFRLLDHWHCLLQVTDLLHVVSLTLDVTSEWVLTHGPSIVLCLYCNIVELINETMFTWWLAAQLACFGL